MDQQELYAWERRCIQEEMPYCRAACPLQVDARAFMERMAAADLPGGRKILERHMPLPGLLGRVCDHPCETRCLRGEFGGSLAIGALERLCVSRTPRQTRPLPIPRKNKSVAVVGDGFAGLTVAWDLGRKGYAVAVFHPEAAVGAALLSRLGVDDASVLEDELAVIRRGAVTFTPRALDIALVDEARASFDAVFVDAESAPHLARLRADLDPVTLLEPEPLSEGRAALCYGGWLEGDSVVTRAAEGRRAAATLERFVTGVSLTAAREKEGLTDTRLWTPVDGVEPVARIEPANGDYDVDSGRSEAARCLRCECMACVRECAYMQHYKGYPKVFARQIYNNGAIVKGQHLANSLINGCSLCGQCEAVCPEDFSMADLCLAARREMVERGYMPPSAHEFALEDMAAADGPECALVVGNADAAVPETASCAHLFFPGCQLAASRGEQVLRVYGHLRSHLGGGVGLALRCCGVPARWAGREDIFEAAAANIRVQWEALGRPRVVAACASCLKTLRESQPDMETVSLWEVLETECPEPAGEFAATLSVHDPCNARYDKAWLGAVRRLLVRHGVRVDEPKFTAETTACCGYGGLTWSAQPEVADAMAAHRAAQLDHDAVASCIMCRDRLAAQGKPCLHILDVLFPLDDVSDPTLPGPGLSARRANRAALRRRVLHDILGRSVDEPAPQAPRLFMEPEVLARLEGRHILTEDVTTVLRHAADNGFLDRRSGHYLTSWRPSRVTYWVEYAPEGDGFRVYDAYSHRMVVPGTGNADEAADKAGGTDTGGRGFQASFRPAAERSGAMPARPASGAEVKS
ncbi:MAG: hypothetical protein DBX67_02860 [Desulfovibrionaceae bacterium]|nr:MAG: hypothetical protein DBX67_02860 [Desulfovibrionaceae bacterium]